MEKIRKMIGCLTAVCLLLAVAAFFLPGGSPPFGGLCV